MICIVCGKPLTEEERHRNGDICDDCFKILYLKHGKKLEEVMEAHRKANALLRINETGGCQQCLEKPLLH